MSEPAILSNNDVEFANDLNKIFIPCRTVIEMEILTALLLGSLQYDKIRDLPLSRPSAAQIIDAFGVRDNETHIKIISFFIDVAVEKLKPVVMYERDHHDVNRVGKVIPYTKTRLNLFFGLHLLKFKFLLIRSFIEMLRKDKLTSYLQDIMRKKSVLSAFGTYYYEKYSLNLEKMLPQGSATDAEGKIRKNVLLKTAAVTNEKILDMATYKLPDEEENDIKFIMRGIKANLFVCKIMFAKIDISHPFPRVGDYPLDPEELMISTGFIAELIPAISQCFTEMNPEKLYDCLQAFDHLMNIVLDSINGAYIIAEGQGKLARDELPFALGIKF